MIMQDCFTWLVYHISDKTDAAYDHAKPGIFLSICIELDYSLDNKPHENVHMQNLGILTSDSLMSCIKGKL